jgi:hypothetical protein
MKTFTIYGKVGMRLAMLTVLGITLMIVAKPTKAVALTCQSDCIAAYHVCEDRCNGIAACRITCFNQISSWMDLCN